MTVRTRLIVPVLLGVLASSPALAQGPTGTPQGVPPQGVPPQGGQPPPAGQPSGGQAARPIFGGGAAKIGQSLTLGLSVGQTFFRTDADETITRPPARTESTFLYGSGNAAYTVDGLRAGASATVSSSGQYYSELSDQIVRGYAGNVGGWLRFSPRTRLTVDQGVTYLPALQQAKVGGFVLPFAGPRHAHEFRCFEKHPLRDDQVLVAGVIDPLTNIIEHPEVVADRLERVAAVIGDPSRVLAGTDCGFDTSAGWGRVAGDVVWAKLRTLRDGARIASAHLFRD